MVKKKRNEVLDIAKGIAIILVVFGHCIQFGNGLEFLERGTFFDDWLFKIIYSFHMPLFMMVSGYFYFFTLTKNSFKGLIVSRINKILVPIFVWGGLFTVVTIIGKGGESNVINVIISYVKYSILSLWFLWAVFWCSLIVLFVNRFFKDNIFVYILGFIVTFVITDSLNFSVYKFMYPFFVGGYLYSKNKEKIDKKILSVKVEHLLIGLFVLYILLIFNFERSSFIYTSGYTIIGINMINQIYINLFRLFIGLFGSVFILLLINFLIKKYGYRKVYLISKLGKESLGIYIISGYLILILSRFTPDLKLNYLINIVETFAILVLSYFFTILLNQFNVTNKFLFGGR